MIIVYFVVEDSKYIAKTARKCIHTPITIVSNVEHPTSHGRNKP